MDSKKYGKTTLKTAKNGVKFLTFDIFDNAGVIHGFSTRYGGVSTGIYESMNLSFHRGDDFDNVLKNHRLFAEAVGYDYKKTVFSDQIHETKIAKVTYEDIGHGMKGEKGIPEMDGLVTDIPGIPLMTFYADCVPLLFCDPVKKVIGAAHSGWRGTVAGMGQAMVEYMKSNMGCNAEDILVVIGPSICKECYEVSEEVAEQFRNNFPENEHDDIIYPNSDKRGSYQLDLWQANRHILLRAGVLEQHIQLPDLCTAHYPEMLISHRKTGGKRGNMAAVIML